MNRSGWFLLWLTVTISATAGALPIESPVLGLPAVFSAVEQSHSRGDGAWWARVMGHDISVDRFGIGFRRGGERFGLRWAGATSGATRVVGQGRLPATVSTFFGADPAGWRHGAPAWQGTRLLDVWPGIDVVVAAKARLGVEVSYLLQPGATPSDIAVEWWGTALVEPTPDGGLQISTGQGTVREGAPRCEQGEQAIACRFVLRGDGRISVEVPAWDPSRPLLIDPPIDLTLNLGGGGADELRQVERIGNQYVVAGVTMGDGMVKTTTPITPSPAKPANTDLFVARYNADGSLVFATWFGGTKDQVYNLTDPQSGVPDPDGIHGPDMLTAMAIDPGGNILLGGWTYSIDFPVKNAAQPQHGDLKPQIDAADWPATDGFVLSLGGDGTWLNWSTYRGGVGLDEVLALATTNSAVFAAGRTEVPGLPGVTNDAIQKTLGQDAQGKASSDGLITRYANVSGALERATYLGGAGFDAIRAIDIHATTGALYLAGTTTAGTFYTTPGAFQTQPGGGLDGFVMQLGPDLKSITWSAYVGGDGVDSLRALDIVEDAPGGGLLWVGGVTTSTNLTLPQNAFQSACPPDGACGLHTFGVSNWSGLLQSITLDGTQRKWGTYLGGSQLDRIAALHADKSGVLVTGWTMSADFPTRAAAQPKLATTDFGGGDAFVAKFGLDGVPDLYLATYLGGKAAATAATPDPEDIALGIGGWSPALVIDEEEFGYAITAGPDEQAVVVGFSRSPDFPGFKSPGAGSGSQGFLASVVTKLADLRIDSVATAPKAVAPSDDFEYHVTLFNDGPLATAGVLSVTLDKALDYVATPGCTPVSAKPPVMLTCAFAAIPRQTQKVLTVKAKAIARPLTVTSTFAATATVLDPNPTNNLRKYEHRIGGLDLVATLTASPAPVAPKQPLVLTAALQNLSNTPAKSVALQLFLPAHVTDVVTPPTCGPASGGQVSCLLTTPLIKGAPKALVFKMKAPPIAGRYPARAEISDDQPDASPNDNTGRATVQVKAMPNLVAALTATPTTAGPKAPVTFALSAKNTGDLDASSVTLTLHAESFTALATSTPGCVVSGQTVQCTQATLPIGQTLSATVTATAPEPQGTYGAAVIASHDQLDADPSDNNATANVTVGAYAALTLTATDAPDPVAPKHLFNIDFVVTNTGNIPAEDVTLGIAVPASVTGNVASNGCIASNGAASCAIGTLAPGASASKTVVLTAPKTPQLLTTTGVATTTTKALPGQGSVILPVHTTVVAMPDLVVTLTAPAHVLPKKPIAAVVRVTNQGDKDAESVTTRHTFGSQVSLGAPPAGCAAVTGGWECQWGTIKAGAHPSRVLTVTAPDVSQSTVVNHTAIAHHPGPDASPALMQSTATTTVVPGALIEVTVVDAPDPVPPKKPLGYSITVKNVGTKAASKVALGIAPGAGYVVTDAGGCPAAGSGTLVCPAVALAAGASKTYLVAGTAPATPGTLPLVALATWPDQDGNLLESVGKATTAVADGPDLLMSAVDTPDPVNPLDTLTWSFSATNQGNKTAPGAVITATLPGAVTSIAPPTGCTLAGHTLTCTPGDLAPGQATPTYILKAKAPALPAGQKTLKLVANFVATHTGEEVSPKDNTFATVTDVGETSRLRLHLSESADPVMVSTEVRYTLTVENLGKAPASGVVVEASLAGAWLGASAGANCAPINAQHTIVCTLGNLGPQGGQNTWTTTILVAADTKPGVITLSGDVSKKGGTDSEGEASKTISTSVQYMRDLEVTVTATPSHVAPNKPVTVDVRIQNKGQKAAQNVALSVGISPKLTSPTLGAGCTGDGGALTCGGTLTLAPGASQTYTFTGKVGSGPGKVTIKASATADGKDGNPSTDYSTIWVPISDKPDLKVTLKQASNPVATERTGTVVVEVSNNGPKDAPGTSLMWTLPTGAWGLKAPAGCTVGPVALTCDLGTLAAGQKKILFWSWSAPSKPGWTHTVLAASSSVQDADVMDDAVSLSITVQDMPDLVLSAKNNSPVGTDAPVTLTLTAENTGEKDSGPVTLECTLPPELSQVAATGCTIAGDSVTCGLPGGLGTFLSGSETTTWTVTAKAPKTQGKLLTTCVVEHPGPDGDPNDDMVFVWTTVSDLPDPAVTLTAVPEPVGKSANLTYTLTVSNLGKKTSHAVQVSLKLPAALSGVSLPSVCQGPATAATCTFGDLPPAGQPGSTVASTITAVSPATEGPITATATLSSSDKDTSSAANDLASFTVHVGKAPKIVTTLTSIPPKEVAPGKTIQYTQTISNLGDAAAKEVTVEFAFDPQLTVSSVAGCTKKAGSGNLSTDWTCPLGTLAPGAAVSRSVLATAPSTSGLPVLTTAKVRFKGYSQAAYGSLFEAHFLDVEDQPDVVASATLIPAVVGPGKTTRLTFGVSNQGKKAASGVTLRVPVNASVGPMSVPAGCAATSTALQCSVGTLAPGQAKSFVTQMTAPAKEAYYLLQVTATQSEPETETANNTASALLTVKKKAELTLSFVGPDPKTWAQGETVTATVKVTNLGQESAKAASATVTIGGAATNATLTGCTATGLSFDCALPALAPGATWTAPASFKAPQVDGTYDIIGSVIETGPDAAGGPHLASTSYHVGAKPILSLQPLTTPSKVLPEDQATLSVFVANSGDKDATNVTLTVKRHPALASMVGSGCTDAGGLLTCAVGAVPKGGGKTLTLSVVAGKTTGVFASPLTITGWSPKSPTDPIPAGTGTVVVVDQPDLVASLSAPLEVAKGKPITIQITASNVGTQTAKAAVAEWTPPPGLTVTSAPGCTAGSPYVCALGDIAPLSLAFVTVVVTAPQTAGHVVTSQVKLSNSSGEATPSDNSATSQTVVTPMADLQITLSGDGTEVKPGEPIALDTTVSNMGDKAAKGVTLTFSGPALGSLTAGGCPGQVCGLGTLGPGATATRTLTWFAPKVVGSYPIVVKASHAGPDASQPDTAAATLTVVERADLVTTIGFNTASPAPTQSLLGFTVSVANVGKRASSAFELTWAMPAGASGYVGPAECSLSGATVTCALAGLTPGQHHSLTFGYVGPPTAGSFTQWARAVTADKEWDKDNNDAGAGMTLEERPDLVVGYAVSPATVGAGELATWTATVHNVGDQAATQVKLQTQLPAGATQVSGCPVSNHLATCLVGSLGAGATTQVSLSYHAPNAAAVITQQATATLAEVDRTPGDNTALATLTVVEKPNLNAALSLSPDPVGTGGAVTGQLTITNLATSSGASATQIQATLPLPAGISGATAAQCAVAGSQITCTSAGLSAGQSQSFGFGYAAPSAAGTLTQTVSLSAAEPDLDPADNQASASITVESRPDLKVSLSATPSVVAPQGSVVVTASLTNAGAKAASGVSLRLPMPFGTSAPVLDPSCQLGGGAMVCPIGGLAAGATAVKTLTWIAPKNPGQVTQTGAATLTETDLNPSDNTASTQVTVYAVPVLAATLEDVTDPVGVGHDIVLRVGLTNQSSADALNVHAKVTLPSAATFKSADAGCTLSAGVVDCDFGTVQQFLLPQKDITIQAPLTPAVLTSRLDVTLGGNADPKNTGITETTTVVAWPDLALTVVGTPNPAVDGATITWTLEVQNNGPGVAQNVLVEAPLPADARAPMPGAGCVMGQHRVLCRVASLGVGATQSFSFSDHAKPGATSLTQKATASSKTSDQSPADNVDSFVVAITPKDSDGDGVSDAVEDAGPNGGDADQDGTRDALQGALTTVPSLHGAYFVLNAPAGMHFEKVSVLAPPAGLPAGVGVPAGLLDFELHGVGAGQAAVVTVTLPTGIPAGTWWKYGPEPGQAGDHWWAFGFDGTTGATVAGNQTVSLHLKDGARGDLDAQAGVIRDPSGPALRRLVVDSAADDPDQTPGDGLCHSASGVCTLRAAIMEVNAHPDRHVIDFDIAASPKVISLNSPLPPITVPVVIDGTSQPGFDGVPLVELDGWSLGVSQPGLSVLEVQGGDSAVLGVCVYGGWDGIVVSQAGRVLVSESFLGSGLTYALLSVDHSALVLDSVTGCEVRRSWIVGAGVQDPTKSGLHISGGGQHLVTDNKVGIGLDGYNHQNGGAGVGIVDATGCRVTDNHVDFNGVGVAVRGNQAHDNTVDGNLLGLAADGTCDLWDNLQQPYVPHEGRCLRGNDIGIELSDGAHHNTVGGTASERQNTIANGLQALLISGGAHDNLVYGNAFGTSPYGTCEIDNLAGFCRLRQTYEAVRISEASSNVVGGVEPGQANVNAQVVISGQGSTKNVVQGNRIFMDPYGQPLARVDIPADLRDAVTVSEGASNNTAQDNLIVACTAGFFATDVATASNQFLNNIVGTDPDGRKGLGCRMGVFVFESKDNTIQGNVLASSELRGVGLYNQATGNTVDGNLIGLDPTGTKPLLSVENGIQIDLFSGLGGNPTRIINNTVAASTYPGHWQGDFWGIDVLHALDGLVIQGNRVGTDVTGTVALPNLAGGVRVKGGFGVVIKDNVIAGNGGPGLWLEDDPQGQPVSQAVIQGNHIGVTAAGDALPNAGDGIYMASSQNTVGGIGPGEGNAIGHNAGAGISIWEPSVTVRGNHFYDNDGLGIDIFGGGLSPDGTVFWQTGDPVPNRPHLSAATSGAQTTVTGTVSGAAGATRTVDFYRTTALDPTGYGEGGTYLGSASVTIPGNGTASFVAPISGSTQPGDFVTATATDSLGSTGELSNFVWVDKSVSSDVSVTLNDYGTPFYTTNGGSWVLKVSNLGPTQATDIHVTLALPTGFAFVDAGPTDWTLPDGSSPDLSCAAAGGVVTCDRSAMAAGDMIQLEVNVTVATPGTYTATATVSTSSPDPNPQNDTATDTILVDPIQLGVSLQDGPDPALVGQTVTTVATVQNLGDSTALGVAAVYTVPDGASFAGAAGPAGACTEAAGMVTCPLGDLPSLASAQASFEVTASAETTLSHHVAGTATPNPIPKDIFVTNPAETTTKVYPALADLSVQTVATPNPASSGQPLSFESIIENLGPSDAANVVVTVIAPSEVQTLLLSQGSCTGTVVLTCALGTLKAGAKATISDVVTTPAGVTSVDHTLSVEADTPDMEPNNNGGAIAVPIDAADLAAQIAGPSTLLTDAEGVFVFTVTNNGPSAAVSPQLLHTVPWTMAYVSATPTSGSCWTENSDLRCALDDLPAGASATITVTLKALQAGDVTLSLYAWHAGSDPVAGNEQPSHALSISNGPAADLALSATASPEPVGTGAALTWAATVTNGGPNPATKVRLKIEPTAAVNLLSATGATCTQASAIECVAPDIASGASAVISVVVAPSHVGALSATLTVSSANDETNPWDNQTWLDSTVEPSVTCPAGTSTVSVLDDNAEGAPQWSTDQSVGGVFALSTSAAKSPQTAWFADEGAQLGELRLTSPPLQIPATATFVPFSFWHRYTLDSGDGGVLRYSTDGGLTWTDATSLGMTHVPAGWVSSFGKNVLGGSTGWNGSNPAWPDFDQSTFDLSALAGQTVMLRFLAGWDEQDASLGWWLDDFALHACVPPAVAGSAEVGVHLAAAPTLPQTGAPLVWTITVANTGPETATSVALNLPLPSGVTLTSVSAVDGSCTGDGPVTCTLADLASGASTPVTLTVTPTATGALTQTASVSATEPDPATPNNSASLTLTVLDGYPCSGGHAKVVLLDDPLDTLDGWGAATTGTAGFALATDRVRSAPKSVHISEPADAADATLTITGVAIPAGTERAIWSFWHIVNSGQYDGFMVEVDAGSGFVSVDNLLLERGYNWTLPDFVGNPLAGRQAWVFQWPDGLVWHRSVVDLSAFAGQTVALRFRAGFNTGTDNALGWWIDDIEVAACPAPAPPSADLAVSMAPASVTVAPGDALSLTATVTNLGPDPATGASLTVTVPAGLDAGSVSVVGGASCADIGGSWQCALGDLAASAEAQVKLALTSTAEGQAAVTATALAAEADPDPSNDKATATVDAVLVQGDLAVSVAAPAEAWVGEPTSFTVTLTNQGPQDEPQARLELALPDGFVASCAGIPCNLGLLAASESVAVTVSGLPQSAGPLALVATAIGTQDLTPQNDAAVSDVTAQVRTADLATAVVVAPESPVVGQSSTWTVTVTQAGPETEDVGLSLVLAGPGEVTAAQPSNDGDCAVDLGGALCAFAAVAAGETRTVTVMVRGDAVGLVTGTAVAFGGRVDPSPEDAVAVGTVSVLADCAALDCDDQNPCTQSWCHPESGCVTVLYGGGCDDGDACTVGDVCVAGACQSGGPADCDDGEPCTDDLCDGASGCLHLANALGCNDGDACTAGDQCAGGACLPGPAPSCDDGEPCTDDGCVAEVGCTHVANTLGCDDGDACTASDLCAGGACQSGAAVACGDGDPCTDDTCDPALGCVHAPNTAGCDDQDACTTGEACQGGGCGGGQAVDCDDQNACTQDACDPAMGCQHVLLAGCCEQDADCDDQNPCTQATCDVSSGDCAVSALDGPNCDDGDACTVGDGCQAGACVPGAPKLCDDGDPCTQDTCQAGACETNAAGADGVSCDDQSACTTGDVCQAGACQGVALDCDDQDPCTADGCQAGVGCVHEPVTQCCAQDADCDDQDLCTQDACEAGSCAYQDLSCDDQDPCTQDQCTPEAGCAHVAIAPCCAVDSDCDDGNLCTTASCQDAACVAGPPPSCDDGDPCTLDGCDPSLGCTTLSAGCCQQDSDCDDQNACTADTCEAGVCVQSLVSCDDGLPCTADSCDPATGCVTAPVAGCCVTSADCDDQNACTNESCHAHACVAGPDVDCDDGLPCTQESCDAATGCVTSYVPGCCAADADCGQTPCQTTTCDVDSGDCLATPAPDQSACDDGSACTEGDTCTGGACVGAPVDCDDGEVCTTESCDAASGCVSTAAAGPCNDDDACTVDDACAEGACAGAPADCDDQDACTTESCDAVTGCAHTPVVLDCGDPGPCATSGCDPATGTCATTPLAAGTGCDDGDPCTTSDACDGEGGCEGAALGCDDQNLCTADGCEGGACTHVWIDGCCLAADQCPAPASVCQLATCGAESHTCGVEALSGGACDDGDPCTSADHCADGVCVGAALLCDDGDACTADTCTPAGCVHTAIEGCAGADCAPAHNAPACHEGELVWLDGCDQPGDTIVSCDDGEPCTIDRCEEARCVHEPDPACGADPCQQKDAAMICHDGNVMATDGCGSLVAVVAICAGDDCVEARCDPDELACATAPGPVATCGPDEAPDCPGAPHLECQDGALAWVSPCNDALGTALSCDDGDPKTEDWCDGETLRCLSAPQAEAPPNPEPAIAEPSEVPAGCDGCASGGPVPIPRGALLLLGLMALALVGIRRRGGVR